MDAFPEMTETSALQLCAANPHKQKKYVETSLDETDTENVLVVNGFGGFKTKIKKDLRFLISSAY